MVAARPVEVPYVHPGVAPVRTWNTAALRMGLAPRCVEVPFPTGTVLVNPRDCIYTDSSTTLYVEAHRNVELGDLV